MPVRVILSPGSPCGNRSVKAPALSGGAVGGGRLPVPGEKFGDAPCRVIRNSGEHVGQVMLRVNAVELGGFDQRVHSGGASAARIGAGEEVVFAADRDTAQSTFGRVVVERQAAILEAADESGPTPPPAAERCRKLGSARELAHGFLGPTGQRLRDRR